MPAPESFPRRALRGGQWSNRKAAWPRQQIAYSCKCMAIVKARFGGGGNLWAKKPFLLNLLACITYGTLLVKITFMFILTPSD